jgi:hypothetical protein
MSRSDALAVGLKLLGAFFVVTGLAEVGHATERSAAIHGVIYVTGGVSFLLIGWCCGDKKVSN